MTETDTYRIFVWCTYRQWSFRVLEGLIDTPGWRCGLVVTTADCIYDFSSIEGAGIRILRVHPRTDLAIGGAAYQEILNCNPEAIFHYGWSWIVPEALLELCPNVTLHPGKLPKDRGGSPIQNQIRNGEHWTYANVLKMSAGLDQGPVYLRERLSLAGDSADDVWARMTSAGCVLSRRFLSGIAAGVLEPKEQANEEPTFYRRVKPEQAELVPGQMTADNIYNIVRAHAETDPNSYVKLAFIRVGERRLVIERATPLGRLDQPEINVTIVRQVQDLRGVDLLRLCQRVNEGHDTLAVADQHGNAVALRRIYVSR